jgi:DNA-binding NarL/FixJ family response regulator
MLSSAGRQERAPEVARVLIVGGAPLLQTGLVAALTPDPLVEIVALAHSLPEALGSLGLQRANVIILDTDSPQRDATAVLRALPHLPSRGAGAKLLLITDNTSPDELLGALRLGIQGYAIRQDLTPDNLRGGVRAMRQQEWWACPTATRILMASVIAAGGTSPAPTARHGLLRRRSSQERYSSTQSHELTAREVEVLRLFSHGAREQQIAEALFLSKNTVKTYLRRVRLKLNAHTRAEAISAGFQLGLIPDRRQVARTLAV